MNNVYAHNIPNGTWHKPNTMAIFISCMKNAVACAMIKTIDPTKCWMVYLMILPLAEDIVDQIALPQYDHIRRFSYAQANRQWNNFLVLAYVTLRDTR